MKIKLFNAPKAYFYCWFELAAGIVITGVGFAYTFVPVVPSVLPAIIADAQGLIC